MQSSSPEIVPVIQCHDLHKEYRMGEEIVRALDGVSVTIKQGEMVAIIGQSGSGKSTLMNLLGCLDTPSSGRYVLDGRDVSGLNDNQLAEVRNRKIGFVFQTFNLLSRTTALENVEVPLFYRGDRHARQKAQQALDRVGLGPRVHHMPNQLSGGQRQRVAIARALVIEPAIVLADEPTGNLDSATGVDIMNLFSELHAQGATIIIVTHEPDIAHYCERQIMIRDGKVLKDEPTPRRVEV
jgi:putative ABC transport system ATP-binding protein